MAPSGGPAGLEAAWVAATQAASSPAGPPPTTTTSLATSAGVMVPAPSDGSRPTAGFCTQDTGMPLSRFP
jgi:hypothetical protein